MTAVPQFEQQERRQLWSAEEKLPFFYAEGRAMVALISLPAVGMFPNNKIAFLFLFASRPNLGAELFLLLGASVSARHA